MLKNADMASSWLYSCFNRESKKYNIIVILH